MGYLCIDDLRNGDSKNPKGRRKEFVMAGPCDNDRGHDGNGT